MVLFRLPREEVWQLTPVQFAACSRTVDFERHLLDSQLAWIRHILYEPNRDKQKQPQASSPKDFLLYGPLDNGEEPARSSSREMTPDEQLDYVRNFLHPHFKAVAEREKNLKG